MLPTRTPKLASFVRLPRSSRLRLKCRGRITVLNRPICLLRNPSVSDLESNSLAGLKAFIRSNLCTRQILLTLDDSGHHDWPDKRTHSSIAVSQGDPHGCSGRVADHPGVGDFALRAPLGRIHSRRLLDSLEKSASAFLKLDAGRRERQPLSSVYNSAPVSMNVRLAWRALGNPQRFHLARCGPSERCRVIPADLEKECSGSVLLISH